MSPAREDVRNARTIIKKTRCEASNTRHPNIRTTGPRSLETCHGCILVRTIGKIKKGVTMKYKPIKFSKKYKKLPSDANGRLARLLFVHKINLENQSEWLLKYDTESVDGTHYELPKKGEYLFLLFELTDGTMFTTMRRWTLEKEKYYHTMEDKFLEIVIADGNRLP
jgi:hypothetical protein